MVTTTDLAKFGARERALLRNLLNAWDDYGLPDGFGSSGVAPVFDTGSGYVFLTNDDYQMAICLESVNGLHRLAMWYRLPSGNEGTLEELLEEVDKYTDPDDLEYLARWCYDGGICPACGDPADYCQGHGKIGDPDGYARLRLFDEYV